MLVWVCLGKGLWLEGLGFQGFCCDIVPKKGLQASESLRAHRAVRHAAIARWRLAVDQVHPPNAVRGGSILIPLWVRDLSSAGSILVGKGVFAAGILLLRGPLILLYEGTSLGHGETRFSTGFRLYGVGLRRTYLWLPRNEGMDPQSSLI